MAIYRVHSEPVRRHYFASACSCGVLFQIVLIVLLIIGPYLLAYNMAGMWLFERCYRYQPDVRFKHEAFFIASGSDEFSSKVWSTSSNFNKLMQKRLRVPTLRSHETDENYDGKMEYLDIEFELPLSESESVNSVSVMLLFDYRLTDMIYMRMESAAYFDYTGGGPGSELTVDGPLVFHQRDPLEWDGSREIYNYAVVNTSSFNPSDYDFTNILQTYSNRNETTVYDARYPVWKADRAATQPFKLKMRVRYQTQRFCFRPGFLQELKFGWIQYLALLVPLWVFATYVQWFIFNNQVVQSIVKLDPFTTKQQ